MATSILTQFGTIAPTLVLVITSERESRNIVHPILGRTSPDVTVRPAALRSGVIEMGFSGPASEAESQAALNMHAVGGVFRVVSDDRPTVEMTYVLNGRVSRELDDATRNAWIVRVEYAEVSA